MENNNSKLNTILLIILILIAAFCAWKLVDKDQNVNNNTNIVPSGQTQTNQNQNGAEDQSNQNTQTQWKKYTAANVSFSYIASGTVYPGNGQSGPFYAVSAPWREDYRDSIHYFPNGIPTEYVLCDNFSQNQVTVGGKVFHYCDSQGEPIRTYIYEKSGKVLLIHVNLMSDPRQLIDLASIEIR